jgi:ATP-dependent helicase HrpB
MANGRGGIVDPADPLAREPFLAVAELQGAAENARILLAAPISRQEIEDAAGPRIVSETAARLDPATGAIRARRQRRLGRLVLSDEAAGDLPDSAFAAALLGAIREGGLGLLPMEGAADALRRRVGFLRGLDPESWPDLSDAALLADLDGWLGPYLAGIRRLSDVGQPRLREALLGLIPWERRAELDRLAPPEFESPVGRRHAIDYTDPAAPLVEVRVQELYGLDRHPTVGGGRVPLVLSLLSPARRPIQVTRDLPSFWRGSWREVRSAMRGRYPKHDWPEDPLAARPTDRAKPRS